MTTLADIRSTFLKYFNTNGHDILPSSPLVPRNDPTLMFTNSGMVQFKNRFTGVEQGASNRATTAQKCVRAGGKHNDLDNVGYTARHHTFFEMLGNFSFGDYFKGEAIPYAWELLTKEYGIDKDRLLVTIYHTDDEAAAIWKKVTGFSDSKIIRIRTDDNFWRMGPTGPCGPCTEIFYDHGDHIWGGPPGSKDEDGDRFIEIWNLVFMQNEQFEDGSLKPLDMQSIDTGMGLERIGALLQGKHDNYDTDVMRALIEASAHATHVDPDGAGNTHHRVIADHLRSTSFLIAEGVLPSNEGRGYVLRRIMRRAMRHAHLLGAKDPIMHRLVSELVQQMGAAYPELVHGQTLIEETLLNEETRFKQTLDRGLKLLDDELARLPEDAPLPGKTAFKLYDTYGFPLDLTQDALRENDRSVDTEGFDAAMAEQKEKARAAWSGTGAQVDAKVWFEVADAHGHTDFLGYDTLSAEGVICAVVIDAQRATSTDVTPKDTQVSIALNQTPFYAESGGQVGDIGLITTETGTLHVTSTQSVAGIIVHSGTVQSGHIQDGQAAKLNVDTAYRMQVAANHSATHLLNEALRNTLGTHIAQRGSLNAADRLRFDFSHTKALSKDDIVRVETEVNSYIRQNSRVETRIMTPDGARELGAQALFGEKYGDEVRVVSMGEREGSGKGHSQNVYSLELCGGTHVTQLGEIGSFILLSDSASSAGVRRIEALTGDAANTYVRTQMQHLSSISAALKSNPQNAAERAQSLLDERKSMSNDIAQLRRELAMSTRSGTQDGDSGESVNGVYYHAQSLTGVTGKDLPTLIDTLKSQHDTAVIFLIADTGGKAAVAVGVTDNLTDRISAVELLRLATPILGGKGGGGRADLAQGGAPSAAQSTDAIARLKEELSSKL